MTEQRTNERRIEQQLDEFRVKWKKEIQQRTVYGHVLEDKPKDQQAEETFNNEEQVEKTRTTNDNSIFCFPRQNISFYVLVISNVKGNYMMVRRVRSLD